MLKAYKKVERFIGQYPVFRQMGITDDLLEMMTGSVRYRVDNIAKYYWTHEDASEAEGAWSMKNDAYFPSLAPPFPHMWFEWEFDKEMATVTLDTGTRFVPQLLDSQVGSLLCSVDRLDPDIPPWVFQDKPDNVRWFSTAYLFLTKKGFSHVKFLGACNTYVEQDGTCHMLPDGNADSVVRAPDDDELDDKTITDALSGHVKPVFLTLSFLACKNGIIIDHDPASLLSKRKRRNMRRLNKPEPKSYKTLKIYPIAEAIKIRASGGSVKGQGKGKPVPIRSGSFATYRDEDGHRLFGKYSGTFWRSARVDEDETGKGHREVII